MAKTKLTIKDVQKWLHLFGYYDGSIDGNYQDVNFRADLRRFQRDYPAQAGAADGWYGAKTESALLPLVSSFEKANLCASNIVTMRRWQLTYYYVGDQTRWGGAANIPMYDPNGKVVATVQAGCYVEAALEGTTKLRDGRLINVATGGYKKVNSSAWASVYNLIKRYSWLNKPGYGGVALNKEKTAVISVRRFAEKAASPVTGYPIEAKGIPLDPFRTLAADNGRMGRHDPTFKGKGGVVPAGTRVFILEFVGVKLPDKTVHDGWFTVNDTGGGIYGAHFDVFTGTREMAKQVHIPGRAHIWFDGVDERLPFDYSYGL
jgi:3D (Asp-Asp-Asp) domain-containing protein